MSRRTKGSKYRAADPPEMVAKRTVELRPGRLLEIITLEDVGSGIDCWFRVRDARGIVGPQFLVAVEKLPEIAKALGSLARMKRRQARGAA